MDPPAMLLVDAARFGDPLVAEERMGGHGGNVPWVVMPTVGRERRIACRSRHPRWRHSPLRVESAYCINCDACVKACPPEFGAVLRRPFTVEIVPELCSGCRRCVPACPVDCIVEDANWIPAPDAWWDELNGVERART